MDTGAPFESANILSPGEVREMMAAEMLAYQVNCGSMTPFAEKYSDTSNEKQALADARLEEENVRRKLRGETWASLRDVAMWELESQPSDFDS